MVETIINKDFTNKTLTEILFPVKEELDIFDQNLIENIKSKDEFLNKISEYIINSGGKRIRPAILYLITKVINNGKIKQEQFWLAEAVELIHTATLIHDDILDEAQIRRGKLTVNKNWNEKIAVISGDFLLSQSLKKLALVKNTDVVSIFSNAMTEICEGEIQQSSQEKKIITINDYIEKSKRKTALLFAAGTESATLVYTKDKELIKAARDYAINYGICFQITDDILNFKENENVSGKPTGIDLANGIYTAPLIYALEEYGNDSELEKIINKTDLTESEIKQSIYLINKSSGIEKSKKLAFIYAQKAVECLEIFADNEYRQSLIDLAYFTLNRKN